MATLFCGNQLIGGVEMHPQIERRERSSVAFLLALSGDARLQTPSGEWTVGANDLLVVTDLRSVVLHDASADWCVEYVAAPVEFWENLRIRVEQSPTTSEAPPGNEVPARSAADPGSRSPEEDAVAARDSWPVGDVPSANSCASPMWNQSPLRRPVAHQRTHVKSRRAPIKNDVLAALCRVLVYDVLTLRAAQHSATDRSARTVKRFYDLLESGIARREREVRYYASRIGVTPKFLTDTIRRVTGKSATAIINSYALIPLKELLEQQELPMTQIAEEMNFHSLSYFSRYASKLLGMTPTRYRDSLRETPPRPIELLDSFGPRS